MTGDQKVEMVESAVNWNQFFVCLRFIFIIFIYTGNFQVSPEKNHYTQKLNPHPKSQFVLSSYYINLLVNLYF